MKTQLLQSDLSPPSQLAVTRPVLIVGADFYPSLLSELEQGACDALNQAQVRAEILHVPGALEIIPAIVLAEKTGRYAGYVALGVVIRGETSHYDLVSGISAQGLLQLGLNGVCLGNGILTVENTHQAWARARKDGQDKGGGAARACLRLLEIQEAFCVNKGEK